jgi:hypothetical protein
MRSLGSPAPVEVPEYLRDAVGGLQRACPNGIPEGRLLPLLVVSSDLSEENLSPKALRRLSETLLSKFCDFDYSVRASLS